MELLLGLVAVVVLDVVALGFGFDSRENEREELSRMEREAKAAPWRA